MARVEAELGWEFIQIYGLTETSPLLTINRARSEPKPANSAGPSAGSTTRRNVCPARRPECGRNLLGIDRQVHDHRFQRPHDEGQTDEDHRDQHADPLPATLMPSGASNAPIQPFGARTAE